MSYPTKEEIFNQTEKIREVIKAFCFLLKSTEDNPILKKKQFLIYLMNPSTIILKLLS